MYESISSLLKTAKQTRNQKQIRDSLAGMVAMIEAAVQEPVDHTTFAKFVIDDHFLFSGQEHSILDEVVDATVETNGLVAQLLDIYGVTSYQDIANRIQVAILSLHAALSRKLPDTSQERTELLDALDTVSLAIS